MKQVCQLDDEGYFVGMTTADESPLEPGVYLIPRGALDVAPPLPVEGKMVRWDGEWVYEDIPQPPLPPEPTFEEILENAYLRRRVELQDSDWTQAVDNPMSDERKQEWAVYRQALRDVPQQEGFPDNISWPTKPTN
jgi:hypothetical protein